MKTSCELVIVRKVEYHCLCFLLIYDHLMVFCPFVELVEVVLRFQFGAVNELAMTRDVIGNLGLHVER